MPSLLLKVVAPERIVWWRRPSEEDEPGPGSDRQHDRDSYPKWIPGLRPVEEHRAKGDKDCRAYCYDSNPALRGSRREFVFATVHVLSSLPFFARDRFRYRW